MTSTPAKVNLLLEVGEIRRQDDRHEIRTVFLPVPQLADEITVTPNPPGKGLTMRLSGRNVPGGESVDENLACRAVRAFCEEFGLSEDYHIKLVKRIPVSGGLGGGSSDAAAALLEMRRLTGMPASTNDLRSLAVRLGADVAFFLNPVPSLGTGIGEVLQPVRIIADYELVIAYPGCPSPVAWAYRHCQRPAGVTPPAWPPSIQQLSSVEGMSSLIWNDLGYALEKKLPFLTLLREELCRCGALAAAVAGSGSSVFGLARAGEGEGIRNALRKAFPTVEMF